MIARAVSCVLAAAIGASAGVRVSIVEHGTERIVSGAITLPAVEVGAVVPLKFRVRATGTENVRIERAGVSGAEFFVTAAPKLPILLLPGAYVDVDAEFRPVLPGRGSGILEANDVRISIITQALPAPVLRADGGAVLRPGEPASFGDVELGGRAVRKFIVENPASERVTVTRLEVAGPAFSSPARPVPFILEPGTSYLFEITFEPKSEGRHGAFLYLNSREFTIEGVATMPAVSKPRLTLDPAAPRCGQQAKVAVRIDAPIAWPVDGVLRMEFDGAPDPAVRFIAGEGRALAFRIAAGDTAARFGSADAAGFQTGSTAGRITFTAELLSYREQLTLDLARAPVEFDSAEARRASASVEVTLAAFDNTRSAAELGFTFFDNGGRMIGRSAIRVDAAADFRRYFDSSALGGVFSLRAVFPVRGDVSAIGSVDVEVVNSQGTARRNVKMTE